MTERDLLNCKKLLLPEPTYDPLKRPLEYLCSLTRETGHFSIRLGCKTVRIWQDPEPNTWSPNLEPPYVLVAITDLNRPQDTEQYLIDHTGLRFYHSTERAAICLPTLGKDVLTPQEFYLSAHIQAAAIAKFVYDFQENRLPRLVVFEFPNIIQ